MGNINPESSYNEVDEMTEDVIKNISDEEAGFEDYFEDAFAEEDT